MLTSQQHLTMQHLILSKLRIKSILMQKKESRVLINGKVIKNWAMSKFRAILKIRIR